MAKGLLNFNHCGKNLVTIIILFSTSSTLAIENQQTPVPHLAEDVRKISSNSGQDGDLGYEDNTEHQFCSAITLRTNAVGIWGRVKKDPLRMEHDVPSCLSNAVMEVWDRCEKRTDLVQGRSDFRDDCVVGSLMNYHPPLMDDSVRLSLGIGKPKWTVSKRGYDETQDGQKIKWAEVYLDQNCNWLPELPESGQMCKAEIDWLVSPISLVWSGESLDKESKIVQFALDPSKPSQWVAWRASAEAPLLVYDPQHTGQITSGAQLFGNWTFGGNKVASLVGSKLSSKISPWEDGYQPLATLDQNGDSVLTDSELAPLGLWFDANRDAITQPGEVVELQRTGVTKIYTKPDGRDDKEQLVFATLGYERKQDGKNITKASIDWFAITGQSVTDVAERYIQSVGTLPKTELGLVGETKTIESKPSHGESLKLTSASSSADQILGLWRWRTNESESSRSEGMFVFGKKNGGLTGYSIVEFGYAEDNQSTNRNIRVTKLNVEKINSDGTITFSAIPDPLEQVKITSTVKLSPDGLLLAGNSNLVNQKTKRTLRYAWSASR